MFPYMEKRALYDDYGEVIRAEDYMMLNPYDGAAPVMRKRVRVCEGNVLEFSSIDASYLIRNLALKWKKSPFTPHLPHHLRKFRRKLSSKTSM